MYEAEKYHGVSIKKLNEERLDQIVASCTLKLSEQGGESSDYDKIVRCSSTESLCSLFTVLAILTLTHFIINTDDPKFLPSFGFIFGMCR